MRKQSESEDFLHTLKCISIMSIMDLNPPTLSSTTFQSNPPPFPKEDKRKSNLE
jgi:hypothetical protein